jgi:uncharacterized protein (TIGR02996 family)
MTQGDALLEAIRDEPDDEGLRLVYADWLEENGDDAKAELIRVQCTLARLPSHGSERERLKTRERELLHKYEKVWLGAMRGGLQRWRFRLGLLEEVTLNVERFLGYAEALLRLGSLSRVEFRRATAYGSSLARCGHLARLRAVNLSYNHLNDAVIIALAESPYLGKLRELRLAHNFIRDAGAQALAASPGLTQLRLLEIHGNLIGATGREALRARFGDRLLG